MHVWRLGRVCGRCLVCLSWAEQIGGTCVPVCVGCCEFHQQAAPLLWCVPKRIASTHCIHVACSWVHAACMELQARVQCIRCCVPAFGDVRLTAGLMRSARGATIECMPPGCGNATE